MLLTLAFLIFFAWLAVYLFSDLSRLFSSVPWFEKALDDWPKPKRAGLRVFWFFTGFGPFFASIPAVFVEIEYLIFFFFMLFCASGIEVGCRVEEGELSASSWKKIMRLFLIGSIHPLLWTVGLVIFGHMVFVWGFFWRLKMRD